MADFDYYVVLGVLPDAEEVVIAAAYRALAKRYHPDRWTGEPAFAHRQMAALNQAYNVLGDAAKRAAYNLTRSKPQADFCAEEEEQARAFASALQDDAARWMAACGLYPDLVTLHARLATISGQLAFAFVTSLLETKDFQRRAVLAVQLEQACLVRYFGTQAAILDYARFLIFSGHKNSAKVLNRFVSLMGADVEPGLLILRVEKELSMLRHYGADLGEPTSVETL